MARAARSWKPERAFSGLSQVAPVVTSGLGQLAPAARTARLARLKGVPAWVWLLSGGSLATVIVLYWKRGRLAVAYEEAGGDIFTAATEVATEAVEEATSSVVNIARSLAGALPSQAQPYADLIESVTARHPKVRPSWTVALGMRESKWGTSPGYKPKGPAGTGDWVARQGSWLKDKNVQVVTALPAGWSKPKGSSPPWAIPKDGLGWGRGLMQLDFGNALKVNWQDAETNIDAGLTLFEESLDFFSAAPRTPTVTLGPAAAAARGVAAGVYPDVRPLAGGALLAAAISAYNQGDLNALRSLAAGVDVDAVTTGKDYSSDVIAMADSIESVLAEGRA